METTALPILLRVIRTANARSPELPQRGRASHFLRRESFTFLISVGSSAPVCRNLVVVAGRRRCHRSRHSRRRVIFILLRPAMRRGGRVRGSPTARSDKSPLRGPRRWFFLLPLVSSSAKGLECREGRGRVRGRSGGVPSATREEA